MKWKNYGERSWEPAESFDSKSKPLQEYKKRKKAQARAAAAVTTLTADLLASPAETPIQDDMCSGRNQGIRYAVCVRMGAM